MRKVLLILVAIFAFAQANAQLTKERSIDIAIGYGLSTPYDDIDITGDGFYLQGEYVLSLAKWVDLRPYAGLILTKSNTEDVLADEAAYKSTANAFLIGGKTRITAPIPWLAPYIEIGIGTSMGSFETLTPFTNIDKSGMVFHIPWSIGLELGPKRNFDIGFTYYEHPSVEQFAGAFAFGVTIPLNKN